MSELRNAARIEIDMYVRQMLANDWYPYDQLTETEFADELCRRSGWSGITSVDRRMIAESRRAIRAERPRPTVDEIEAKRAELKADGKPDGTASIAKALGTSDSTVKRVLREARGAALKLNP